MDWMQFVSALVSSLAWPAAAFGIVMVLKGPLLRAIPKIRSLKYGELHIDLSEELKAVEQDLTATPSESDSPPPLPALSPDAVRLAEASPGTAILIAWKNVEKALGGLALRHGVLLSRSNSVPPMLIMALQRKGLLDEITVSTLNRLFMLRNSLSHDGGHGVYQEPSLEDALSMLQSCDLLVERLNAI
ncbi:hypothetical protein AB4P93_22740 [Pseudomonas sp. B26140]|uniref:hypothetical protein n=1 Tax=Pseudomonas sp. B26140 TaxID=3235112 RepID=UPI0037845E3C